MALNFASATRPGGGFLSGAQAQEESLVRSSGLYACIKDSPFYEVHRGLRDPFYSHHVIYSPDVPVFRDDVGSLLDRPYPCSFLTCAAPNKGAILDHYPERLGQVDGVMRSRIDRILDLAYELGHRSAVPQVAEPNRFDQISRSSFPPVLTPPIPRGDEGLTRTGFPPVHFLARRIE